MYILPKCSASGCIANGTFINDDGVSASLEGNANIMDMVYSYDFTKNDTVLFQFN